MFPFSPLIIPDKGRYVKSESKENPLLTILPGLAGNQHPASTRLPVAPEAEPLQFRESIENMAYCVWNYLSTPNDGNRFSLVDDDRRRILSPELAAIIAGKR